MAYKLIGKNFTPPDIEAKVTGSAKYAEDFRADGMAHVKFWASPMPHGRVKSIDLSAAEKVPGYLGAIAPDEIKQPDPGGFPILSKEPAWYGAPVVLIAGETEQAAADAVAAVKVDMELLPFVVDPLESLKPDGPNALGAGNVAGRGIDLQTIKWKGKDFALAGDESLPLGKAAAEWGFGDVEAGFAASKVIVEESMVHATNSHHAMEPRSAAAYWENGKCHVWGVDAIDSFRSAWFSPDDRYRAERFGLRRRVLRWRVWRQSLILSNHGDACADVEEAWGTPMPTSGYTQRGI